MLVQKDIIIIIIIIIVRKAMATTAKIEMTILNNSRTNLLILVIPTLNLSGATSIELTDLE
jgi:hypothetical protein